MPDAAEILSQADDGTLEFIKKDADAYIAAQLTVALAGNQRAMTFFGFLATASAVIGGASVTALASHSQAVPYAYVGLAMISGFLVSMFLANRAAMPDAFNYVGNTPDSWLDDVQEKKDLKLSKAEALADTARCIERNDKVLKRSAKLTNYAVGVAWGSLLLGAAASGALIVAQRLGWI